MIKKYGKAGDVRDGIRLRHIYRQVPSIDYGLLESKELYLL